LEAVKPFAKETVFMPIYEYECRKCHARFELLVSAAQADKVRCEKCGSKNPARLLSRFGVAAATKSSASCGCDDAPACGADSCDNCDFGGDEDD